MRRRAGKASRWRNRHRQLRGRRGGHSSGDATDRHRIVAGREREARAGEDRRSTRDHDVGCYGADRQRKVARHSHLRLCDDAFGRRGNLCDPNREAFYPACSGHGCHGGIRGSPGDRPTTKHILIGVPQGRGEAHRIAHRELRGGKVERHCRDRRGHAYLRLRRHVFRSGCDGGVTTPDGLHPTRGHGGDGAGRGIPAHLAAGEGVAIGILRGRDE